MFAHAELEQVAPLHPISQTHEAPSLLALTEQMPWPPHASGQTCSQATPAKPFSQVHRPLRWLQNPRPAHSLMHSRSEQLTPPYPWLHTQVPLLPQRPWSPQELPHAVLFTVLAGGSPSTVSAARTVTNRGERRADGLATLTLV